ncbi:MULTISPECIES: DUF6959 family protein [Streptomyces]|uniref:Uncharacterized protein n=1 Tax=Streptomyces caniscabiei TaxID=2746961 RepID=A0ABU4MSA4_9ACTN|nr:MULTISPECIES: hypothetical protein [Streptomyces]MBE4737968.1 hypothetical protein [Streptomyces caniscabiei]MBE4757233.1 hypothetical protein [Streptomyces caniscabiei]MBE4769232.1 hypothetical protein [Streptomyces caniscabiei]MBE4785047.1 hypothetical protein [Streptomyces caniscabiei]MBE4795831.1 hypothetical protein [Streptomyces caniscabiei]
MARWIIRADVAEVVEACDQGDMGEAREATALVLSRLDELPARYAKAPHSNGILFPCHQAP